LNRAGLYLSHVYVQTIGQVHSGSLDLKLPVDHLIRRQMVEVNDPATEFFIHTWTVYTCLDLDTVLCVVIVAENDQRVGRM
jgi:hypothetical protein